MFGALPRRANCKVNCGSSSSAISFWRACAASRPPNCSANAEKGKVLYDTLEMEPPPVDVPLAQQQLDQELGSTRLRRAIVVPNSRLAYLARLAFGEGEYRVFYNDIVSAVKWLADQPATS